MKLIEVLKKVSIVAAFVATVLSVNAAEEIFTLTSGEVFTGEPAAEKDGIIPLKTKYGVLSIPVASISKKELAMTTPKSEDAKVAEAPAPAPEPKKEDPAAPTPEDKDPEWVEDYRNFVQQNFPEGWQFRLKGGIEYRDTDSSTYSFYASFDVKKEWDVNIFAATLYYNYTSQTDSAGAKDVTVDNYGLDTTFKRFFNETKTWYFANLLNYKRDQVKGVQHQVDEAFTLGYRFDFKRHNLIIDIGPGPAVRYVDTYHEGVEWVAMALFQEDLSWIISKTFRLEQSLTSTLDLQDTSKYSATFKIALIAHLTKVMDLALRYSYQYDNISSSTVTTEQRLILAFEFPFNWQ
ncbi:MAG: DUF481 domain-containing protein [Opitutales bacterium]|nr:DUF481 domain-containing protein [Opitutales bacterium]